MARFCFAYISFSFSNTYSDSNICFKVAYLKVIGRMRNCSGGSVVNYPADLGICDDLC